MSGQYEKDLTYTSPSVYVSKKGELVALTCPNCGYDVQFGQSTCVGCGSGLMRKEGVGSTWLLIPNEAYKITLGVDIKKYLNLEDAITQAMQLTGGVGYVYFMFRDVPVLVGEGIGVDDALENFSTTMKQKSRNELGEKWLEALRQFNSLLSLVDALSVVERKQLEHAYFATWDKNAHLPSQTFFLKPSFEAIELIMEFMVGDDADCLMACIADISSLLPR